MTPVSRETAERLDRLVEMLLQWQNTTNLIAPSTILHLWTRHIADSLQLLPLAPNARTWVDLGSGGGFPGLALACALVERPEASMQLVESNLKKIAFLREAIRVTGHVDPPPVPVDPTAPLRAGEVLPAVIVPLSDGQTLTIGSGEGVGTAVGLLQLASL